MAKDILVKPVISEKSELLAGTGCYTFVVNKKVNKIEIKKEIEKVYGVTVKKVRTLIVPGKIKVRNTKSGYVKGLKPSYKKAMVTLAEGDELELFTDL